MEFSEAVNSRRSVRKTETRNISRDLLDKCVDAALLAPSACNSQPWKFIIVDDASIRTEINRKVLSGLYSMNTFAHEAPAMIVLLSTPTDLAPMAGGILRSTDFRLTDIGMACENLVLKATDLGLGTCILGWFNEKALKKILHIPRKYKAALLISVGFPPRDLELKERRLKDRKETVSYNGFSA